MEELKKSGYRSITAAEAAQAVDRSISRADATLNVMNRRIGFTLNAKLSSSAATRKATPMATGLLDYFPKALAAVAELSRIGNDQHNPGQPLHWAREKSTDHADCIMRHLVDRGTFDTDGVRHAAKVAWRALALLQTEIENADIASEALATRAAAWGSLVCVCGSAPGVCVCGRPPQLNPIPGFDDRT